MTPAVIPASIVDRRRFCAALGGLAALPEINYAQTNVERTVFYAAVGSHFTLYRVDDNKLTLTADSRVSLPAPVQYVWPHPSRKFLYIAWSNRFVPNQGEIHGLSAFAIDPASGRLQKAGPDVEMSTRPISITVDATGDWLLAAYNLPSSVTVHPISRDGLPGVPIKQEAAIDAGIYAHQVRFAPSNRTALLVTRGNDAAADQPEDPGAIKIFDFRGGQLSREQSVAPGNGFGFGPRHLDFHPSQPWVYVSVERQNQLQVFGLNDGRLMERPLFTRNTLRDPASPYRPQMAGPIHVRGDGKFVYLANRADGITEFQGRNVFAGGENSIAVFRVDQKTGEPALIQNIDTQSFHPRTFSIHPNGAMLVSASVAPMLVRNGEKVVEVPAALTVFRLGGDGRLAFVRKYAIDTTPGTLFWCGFLAL